MVGAPERVSVPLGECEYRDDRYSRCACGSGTETIWRAGMMDIICSDSGLRLRYPGTLRPSIWPYGETEHAGASERESRLSRLMSV